MDLCNPSEIKTLLESNGFHFSKSLGQNFLIEGRVPLKIAEGAGIDETFGVLEIGPGIGALTKRLSERAGKVVAVELDKSLPKLLAISLADCDNVEIISGDILKTDIEALVKEKFAGMRLAVCANLPYNITTPVLTKLMDTGLFETITVMIQREVARRIASKPGSDDYGAFTVYANYHAVPEILFDVPPGCFMPAPKVTSSVIKFTRRDAPPAEVKDEKMFFRVVRASFAQRRKTLVNGLSAAFPLSKEDLAQVLSECGLDAKVRGETLGIPEFARIAEKIGEKLGAN